VIHIYDENMKLFFAVVAHCSFTMKCKNIRSALETLPVVFVPNCHFFLVSETFQSGQNCTIRT